MLTTDACPQRGFTLVELAVAVAVLAIVVAWAIPSTSAWIGNAQMRAGAESIKDGLRKAQAEAVRRNREVEFLLTNTTVGPGSVGAAAAANGSNWMVRNNVTTPTTTDYVDGRNKSDLSQQITVAGQANVIFSSLGRAMQPGTPPLSPVAGNVVYRVSNPKDGTRPLCVVLTPGGSAKMCDPTVTNTADPRACVFLGVSAAECSPVNP